MNLLFIEDEKKKRDFIIDRRRTEHQNTAGPAVTVWKELQPASDGWVKQQEVK